MHDLITYLWTIWFGFSRSVFWFDPRWRKRRCCSTLLLYHKSWSITEVRRTDQCSAAAFCHYNTTTITTTATTKKDFLLWLAINRPYFSIEIDPFLWPSLYKSCSTSEQFWVVFDYRISAKRLRKRTLLYPILW